jgi:putative membrane protein
MKQPWYVPAAAAALLGASAAYGPSTAPTVGGTGGVSPAPGVSRQDRAWLQHVHEADLAEVEIGEMAAKKGTGPAVSAAGTMLVTDHDRFDIAVVRTARSLGVDLPTAATPKDAATRDRLADETGSTFDHDFTAMMIIDHEKIINDTRAEIGQGSSPQVTGLARQALPMLTKHRITLQKAALAG